MQVPWTVDVRTSGENRLVRTGSPTGVEVYHHDHPTTAKSHVSAYCWRNNSCITITSIVKTPHNSIFPIPCGGCLVLNSSFNRKAVFLHTGQLYPKHGLLLSRQHIYITPRCGLVIGGKSIQNHTWFRFYTYIWSTPHISSPFDWRLNTMLNQKNCKRV